MRIFVVVLLYAEVYFGDFVIVVVFVGEFRYFEYVFLYTRDVVRIVI